MPNLKRLLHIVLRIHMTKNWNIHFQYPQTFGNRREAGKLLGVALESFEKQNPLILGIPRGGILVAQETAHYLNADFDVVFCHKIGAPENPEAALGAVNEHGDLVLYDEAYGVDTDHNYMRQAKEKQMELMNQRIQDYRAILNPFPVQNRTVIIVDDGAAMGLTLKGALMAIRKKNPAKVIAALPLAPKLAIEPLAQYADHLICLSAPQDFQSVSQFYEDFPAVEDAEIFSILRAEANRRKQSQAAA